MKVSKKVGKRLSMKVCKVSRKKVNKKLDMTVCKKGDSNKLR